MWIAIILPILVISLSAFILIGPRFGWHVEGIRSASMEPTLSAGGAVITESIDAYNDDIEVGDIITFWSQAGERRVCHRVTGITHIGLQPNFQTKGDANDTADTYIVPAHHVESKVIHHIPYLGYFANFCRTLYGQILLLVLPGLMIIAGELRNIWQALSVIENKGRASHDKDQPNPVAAFPFRGKHTDKALEA